MGRKRLWQKRGIRGFLPVALAFSLFPIMPGQFYSMGAEVITAGVLQENETVAHAATGIYIGRKLENGIVKFSNITYATAERWQTPVLTAENHAKKQANAQVSVVSVQSRAEGKP